MSEEIIDISSQPTLIISAMGQLYIKGSETTQVKIRSADEDLKVEQDDNTIRIQSKSDLDIRTPIDTTIQIETVQSEASIRNISGPVGITQASGSLAMRSVGTVSIEQVSGELHARNIEGDFEIKQLGGFANVRNINGGFSAASIGGHLNLKNASGDVYANVGGNANIVLNPLGGQNYSVKAGGALTCQVPNDLDAEVSIKSKSYIHVKVGEISEADENKEISLTFGAGTATIDLSSGGPLSFTRLKSASPAGDFDFDFTELKDIGKIPEDVLSHVSDQISAQMEMVQTQLSGLSAAYSSSGLSAEKIERMTQRTEEKMKRAREKIERAQERAARKITKAENRRHRKLQMDFGFESNSRRAAKEEPVSEEERMLILNMLAEQKISIEEAESLLAALEGKA